MTEESLTRFPADIELASPPLAEAWLEIRWNLEPVNAPNFMRDPGYQIALGRFTDILNDEYPIVEDLDASRIPSDMAPHVVRHRFRAKEGGWPLFQLGPGVATVNFTMPYSWEMFRNSAIQLRSTLASAYRDAKLDTALAILRYRNATTFVHSESDFLTFLSDKLNIEIQLPADLPGAFTSKKNPMSVKLDMSFTLDSPSGVGSFQVGTGTRGQEKDEIAVWDVSISSSGENAPSLEEEEDLMGWLDKAHVVIHEWFFALVEGPLMKELEGEEA